MRLKDKVALVTGGGRGIGRHIALRLADEGADVLVNYASSEAGAQDIAAQIRGKGRRAIAVKANIAQRDEVDAMFERLAADFGRIDILVNNSAIDPVIPFLDMTDEQWDRVIDINLKGTYMCSQAAARLMVKQGNGGNITIIGSMHSMATFPGMLAYASTKGGLNAMTRAMALDLSPHRIRVNCVIPGSIHVEKAYEVIPNYDPHMIDDQIALGRIGYGPDIAAAVVFMASGDAEYITGTTLNVDGGVMARMALWFDDLETVERKYDP
ncbi:MAG: glucose 1-dehydrogenase [Chloroflexi bacterium]|nr:glucose 1-dehydrogenase [Chloroflexota bacterium]